MSLSGSPSTAMKSAYFPASIAPTRSCQFINSAALSVAARIASRGGMPRLGVKMSLGYVAGGPERQGRNVDELVALSSRGMRPLEATRARHHKAREVQNLQV